MNVNQKQAASEHPESDLIGTPLRDVAAKLGRHDVHLSAPSVNAGAELTRGKYPSGIGGAGAAGLVVRKAGQSSGAFVMTCAHVLGPKALVPNPDGDVVYSPALQTFLGIECNNSFGQVDSSTLNSNNALLPAQVPAQITIGQDSFGVDAALIQVSSNATATNIIPTIGQIADVRDLVQMGLVDSTTKHVTEQHVDASSGAAASGSQIRSDHEILRRHDSSVKTTTGPRYSR